MPKIWENNKAYLFLRRYVDWCTRRSYRSFRVEGSLPEGGAVLIAPNHTNTLMDALVVLATRRSGTAFGARADVFSRPRIARILHWMKIVPLVRERDGLREVERNRETMAVIDDALAHGTPFCMFPEGRHRPMHSLLPLKKGISRMAFESAAARPTCIVPVGIEYSDFFHYRGTCRLRFGAPIDVNAFVAEHGDCGEAERHRALLQELSDRIKGLILYIPDDENYEAALREAAGPRRRKWWRWPLAVLTLPLWLCAAVLSLPLWAAAESICHFKIQDPAFRNTVRFAVRLVGEPLCLLLWAIPAFLLFPAWAAFLVLLGCLFSYNAFYDWLNLVRQ